MHKRNRSEVSTGHFLQEEGNNRSDLEASYAAAADVLLAQHINAILGRELLFKDIDEDMAVDGLTRGTMHPLHWKQPIYQEEKAETEYKKRLLSFLDFLRIQGPKLPSLTFYALLEKVVDEFRPAILMELFHPDLEVVVKEEEINRLISFLKSDFCHWRLIGCTVQMMELVERNASPELIAEKIRRFFIPLLGLLSNSEGLEPEINTELKKLIFHPDVEEILKEFECERDEIPIGIEEGVIPTLLDLKEEPQFLSTEETLNRENNMPPSLPTPTPEKAYKELALRRCCSEKDLKPTKLSEHDTILHFLAANESTMAIEILKSGVNDEIDSMYPEFNIENDSDIEPDSPIDIGIRIFGVGSPGNSFRKRKTTFNNFEISLHKGFEDGRQIDEKVKAHPFFKDFNYLLSIENIVPYHNEWITTLKNDELTVLCKDLKSKSLYMVKAFTFIDATPREIELALNKPKFRERWDNVLQPDIIDIQDHYEVIHYKIQEMIGITNRDLLVQKTSIRDYPDPGMLIIHIQSTEHKECPPDGSGDFIRAKVVFGGLILRPEDGGTTVSAILKYELAGLMPEQMLLKWFSNNASQWFQNLNYGIELVRN